MECSKCDYYKETWMFNCCELTQDECFSPNTKERACYHINDDYIFKEDNPFFGFKKGVNSKTMIQLKNNGKGR